MTTVPYQLDYMQNSNAERYIKALLPAYRPLGVFHIIYHILTVDENAIPNIMSIDRATTVFGLQDKDEKLFQTARQLRYGDKICSLTTSPCKVTNTSFENNFNSSKQDRSLLY